MADPVRDAAKMLEFGAHPSSDLPDCYIVHGADIRALRAALERPANDAGAMRHAAAEIARRGAFAAYEEMTDTGHDTEKKHTYSECMDAIGDALSECEAQIRALPLPAPSRVEEADPRMVNSDGEPFGPRLVKMLRAEADEIDDPIGFDDRCRIAVVLTQAADYIEASLAAERDELEKGGDRG